MDEPLVNKKFVQWTYGLDTKQARISIFKHIRDIPYAIIPKLRNPAVGPAGMLELNRGSCQPKHFLLVMLFNKLNLPTRYVTYPFKWNEQPMKYPDDLKKMTENLPLAYHLTSKAHIGGRWVLVDATHDLLLESAGFPVNKDWDGESDTLNAVTPKEEIIHNTLEERLSYESAQRAYYSEEEKKNYADFVDKLNLWLKEIRKQ